MGSRLADSPHHRVENWKFMIVIVIYYVFVNISDSKLNVENETYCRDICRSHVHYGVCPRDFIWDEVFMQIEVFDSALDKGKIDIDLLRVVNLRDVEDQSNEDTVAKGNVRDNVMDIIEVGRTSRNVLRRETVRLPTTSSFPLSERVATIAVQ